ncbi:phosphoribosylformylglycinamidine cyclo-ligase [Periweissella beninensis]|uniref:Phosphoribosylformylglycinamidine cyclo-ligase n=1 Tax=Periweissella beninensis TaxID=504936 RepID=A0ABT0VFY1_9LACO|nr:phosphoribosylformylglycinamidine cyclo-ligase [Periweissella beninensis]MBM7543862.1 phosphoribosylformylglycinamidine cyclo-ligase [Periweissella beninensis]MCM2436757.1 phosphoribosylformylglycinamidine cyclo-ligase [Periweissella beninensis]MCT4395533.1 phosphoribosylformylglycinamidine cyclo-ligase [Periweissella beninensis]
MTDAYAQAGVDISAGNTAVNLMKAAVNATHNDHVLTGLGSFGSLFSLPANFKEPILVAGSDGVGSKLLLAIAAQDHTTIGQDLVAMVVNDILAQGAQPLFLLDYIGTNHVNPQQIATIVGGIAQACQLTKTALIGGETAELPALYGKNHYDLAGFAVGIVEKKDLLDGSKVQVGDVVIGLAASGLHSNGFTLARKILLTDQQKKWADLSKKTQAALLNPTKLYGPTVLPLIDKQLIKGAAHITGGGLLENLPRAFGSDVQVELDLTSWHIPMIYQTMAQLGKLTFHDLLRTFNLGIGFCLIVAPEHVTQVLNQLAAHNEEAHVIGHIKKASPSTPTRLTMIGEAHYGD